MQTIKIDIQPSYIFAVIITFQEEKKVNQEKD